MSNILDKFRNNFLLFAKVIDPRNFSIPFASVHKEISTVLTNTNNKKINIIIPRGTGKSMLIGEKFPLWHLFVDNSVERKVVVIVSKTQTHSIHRLQGIKDVIEYSPTFRQIFGYWGRYNAKIWRQDIIELKNGNAVIARGMGQPIRGINIGGQRPTLIIIDDPEDENNTKTIEAMDANLRWVLAGAVYALDVAYGRIAVIGTPLHENSIVMQLKKSSEWTTLHYKYLNTTEDGQLYSLWSEMKSVERLLAEKEEYERYGKLHIWYAEIQCEIVANEQQLFRKEYFRYYTGTLKIENGRHILEGTINEKPFKKIVNVYMGVDPASSVSQTADYSVIMPIAIDSDNNRYILPYFRGRVSPFHLVEKIKEYYTRYKPIKTRIESVGYQEMLREYFRSQSDIIIPGTEIRENPRNAKSMRIESLEPFFYSNLVYLQPNMSELESELLAYPRGSHDDTLDALYYAFKGAYPPASSEISTNSFGFSRQEQFLNWKVC